MLASLYLMAYEMLKDTIITRVDDLYRGSSQFGKRKDSDYEKDVLSLDKYPLLVSCLWFKNLEAVTESDIDDIKNFREHRDKIAHKLLRLLVEPDENINVSYFHQMRKLLQKLNWWWIANIECGTNPYLDGIEFSEGDVKFPLLELLDYLVDISLSITDSFPPKGDPFSNN
ncbi:MAG: hypothetical protein E4H01_12720 [Lysobacterales bacterium]|nr:MAG: hypothetical protein E4H01_12720 [Xanthomonadales bacterium]